MIDKAFRTISRLAGSTYVEGTDTQIDHVAENYAVYLLDNYTERSKHSSDPTFTVGEELPAQWRQDILDALERDDFDNSEASIFVTDTDYPDTSWSG